MLAERDMLRDAKVIEAMWRLLGPKIVEHQRDLDIQFAHWNVVYLGAGQSLHQIMDDPVVAQLQSTVTPSQPILQGERCHFPPEATLEGFPSCLG